MSRIKLLSKDLINKIAAGEVVERPASVLKELLENSLDAGSKNIKIYIEDSGTKLIRVDDDGTGISKDDLSSAIEQHATSKISQLDDLFSINTLGFRGEALASISSVADSVIINSKTETENGARLVYSTDLEISDNQSLVSKGTSIEIHDLFKNIPARKKFLKTTNTEKRHMYDMFISLALPYLDVHFELYSDQKLIYKLTSTNDIKNRLFEVFGKDFAKHVSINEALVNNIKILGILGDSHLGLKKNKNQFVYVNGRSIKSGLINQAVQQAYQGHLHRDLKPAYILMLQINPAEIDVNIHPRKLEVKFEDEKTVFSTIYSFVNKNLEKNNTFENETISNDFVGSKPKIYTSDVVSRAGTVNDAIRFSKDLYSSKNYSRPKQVDIFAENLSENVDDSIIETFNVLQIFNTYLCFEKENTFYMVDQHAAAEKILFEKLLKNHKNISTMPLLVPEIVTLNSKGNKELILEQKDELKEIGFVIEDFGQESIQITEIPELAKIDSFNDLVNEFLSDSNDLGISYSSELINKYKITKEHYLKLATIACHGSIRAGQRLHQNEMNQIVVDVLKLETGATCPHGRPIVWQLKKTEIENTFNRDI